MYVHLYSTMYCMSALYSYVYTSSGPYTSCRSVAAGAVSSFLASTTARCYRPCPPCVDGNPFNSGAIRSPYDGVGLVLYLQLPVALPRAFRSGFSPLGCCARLLRLLLHPRLITTFSKVKIPEHIGRCSFSFFLFFPTSLQLPIDDPYLDEMEAGPRPNIQPVAGGPSAPSAPTNIVSGAPSGTMTAATVAPAAAGAGGGGVGAGAVGHEGSHGGAMKGSATGSERPTGADRLPIPPGTVALPAPFVAVSNGGGDGSSGGGDVEMGEGGEEEKLLDAAAVDAAVASQVQVPFGESGNPVMSQVRYVRCSNFSVVYCSLVLHWLVMPCLVSLNVLVHGADRHPVP